MRNLDDKTVVITGASRGIGAEIARLFATEKCKLVLCGRDQQLLDQVVDSLALPESDTLTISADIQTAAGMKQIVEQAYDKFGQIDVFVNNAGVGIMGQIVDTTEQDYDAMLDTNLKAVYFSFKELIPRMKKQGGGQIINISSMAGKQGSAGIAVYAASKAALNILSESVASEVRNDNIKICVLAPGSTSTDFGGTPASQKSDRPRLTATEVAETVLFLAKQNENAWISHTEMRPLITRKI